MMKKTYYEKVGRRYIAVSEYDDELLHSFSKGTHLVVCQPGVVNRHYNIDPDLAPLIAAGVYAKSAIVDAIVQASALRPSRKPITESQRAAWNNLAQSFGEDMYSLHGPSATDIAQAGTDALIAEAEKLLSNPAVREAYEQFLLVASLARDY